MKKNLFIVAALAFMSVGIASAQLKNADGNAVVAKVKSANESVKSISCKFTQTKKMSFSDQVVKSDGDFYFTKDNKLSMKYTNGEVLVMNGNEVVLGKKGKTRKLKATNKHAAPLVATLLGCVSGDLNKLDGQLESAKEQGGVVVINVKVDNFKVGQSLVSKVEIKYGKNNIIESINLIEADGSYTLYELQQKTLNKAIDEGVYSVK